MEWVETTGPTVEDAKDAALDQLGVDEHDAEFEVLEEPRTGLFGRTRGEARVRARVRPTQPRPKAERRDRRSKSGSGGGRAGARDGAKGDAEHTPPNEAADTTAARDVAAVEAPEATDASGTEAATPPGDPATGAPTRPSTAPRSRPGGRGGSRQHNGGSDDEEKIEMSEDELAAQGEVVTAFLVDLLDAFGLQGTVSLSTSTDDGALELAVEGDDLGLLIGPKGQTLQAVQELSRSALQRQRPGETHARVRVDVGGYRERRRAALERFVQDIAQEVQASGVQKALEPMSPPDRKVVHDTVNVIDGVTTISEGEDARRRVVILPA